MRVVLTPGSHTESASLEMKVTSRHLLPSAKRSQVSTALSVGIRRGVISAQKQPRAHWLLDTYVLVCRSCSALREAPLTVAACCFRGTPKSDT